MRSRRFLTVLALVALFAGAPGSAGAETYYDVRFDARLLPTERTAHVEIRVRQAAGELRSLAFRVDETRHGGFAGDGRVVEEESTVTWEVPEAGGSLRYVVRVDHLRDGRSYDARLSSEWALFRGDDLVPPARAVTRAGALSRSRLRLRAPEGWSSVTPYPRDADGSHRVDHPGRGFDRPTGWMLAGRRLGVVRERIEGVRFTLAGPVGQGFRRLDLLALLRWTVPELRGVVPELPERVTIVGANDPMWRGGLSGPGSLYIHADRPLMTPDGTSPVLHELMHTLFARGAGASEDWLVEGLAEYYALAVLRRSKTVSKARHEKTLAGLAERGAGVRSIRVARSTGEVTARAVTLLAELDARIREASEGERSLDDVVRQLVTAGVPLATDPLRAAAEQVAGQTLERYFDRRVFRAP